MTTPGRATTRPRPTATSSNNGVVVGVLAGAGVGIAAGVGAFEGTSAPPDVSTSFTQLNKMADAATKQGFAQAIPEVDVSKAALSGHLRQVWGAWLSETARAIRP